MGKLALFVGSGISRPSGVTMVDGVTSSVLNGEWTRMSDGRFLPGPCTNEFLRDNTSEKAQSLIRLLDWHIREHIAQRDERVPNYEDYYAGLRQVVDDISAEYVNPLIAPFCSTLETESKDLWKDFPANISRTVGQDQAEKLPFASLADIASDFIQWAVYHSLSFKAPKGLEFVGQCAERFGQLDIFTLNHDLLMEEYLGRAEIGFADGFNDPEGNCMLFNCSWDRFHGPVRLYKLHGSVDWYTIPIKSRNGTVYLTKANGDPDHLKDSKGNFVCPIDVKPHFLTGTYVKEREYGHAGFAEHFERFRACLAETRNLVCSGYGWGDKEINTRINQWLHDHPENRIIVLHNGEFNSARFWWNKWDKLTRAGKLVHHPKWLCETTANEIETYLA